ncbi:hypothetical protein GCM10007049_19450 [Echinicola pacifica]|uniref:Uncharacterized protein n=1 Tax=Echinicola pacifica TaxID=346377 RepID=A0A918PXZ0_9BACT|nr:hypothetical protein [Echinicola pacifica]GGZ26832.1 hypothetical protein GCM10007049_19450 [Echinicola pacifica]
MKTLSDHWVEEGWIDFEYKKYLLLAYLKEVESAFTRVRLYPPLADLIRHYQNLKILSENKKGLQQAFPTKVVGLDPDKLQFKRKSLLQESEMMKELDDIIAFSLPELKRYIEEGKGIYDFIEEHIQVEPVGLSPLYQREGYVFISCEKSSDIHVYNYQIKLFENSTEHYRGIAFSYLRKEKKSLAHSYEQIKLDLVRSHRELPNPAAWRVHSNNMVPLEESLLPVSKRMLLRMIA